VLLWSWIPFCRRALEGRVLYTIFELKFNSFEECASAFYASHLWTLSSILLICSGIFIVLEVLRLWRQMAYIDLLTIDFSCILHVAQYLEVNWVSISSARDVVSSHLVYSSLHFDIQSILLFYSPSHDSCCTSIKVSCLPSTPRCASCMSLKMGKYFGYRDID